MVTAIIKTATHLIGLLAILFAFGQHVWSSIPGSATALVAIILLAPVVAWISAVTYTLAFDFTWDTAQKATQLAQKAWRSAPTTVSTLSKKVSVS